MKEFTYIITDPAGVHARPAGLLVKKTNEYNCTVTMKCGEKSADAKRIFAVMGLGAKQGQPVTFQIEGEEEEKACAELEAFMKENL